MSSVYKKFTAQDFSVIPFNAHKQYVFNSSSAASNQITKYNTEWTSESISLYSSASTNPNNLFDPINAIKYNQIDHLFYKNFKNDISNRFGNCNYLKQKRELYKKANILSIPAGFYGHEIKKESFFLSSSGYKIVDDTYGNLIISGTDINNFPTDIRSNIFRIGPIKGFQTYDLNVYNGYVVELKDPNQPYEITKRFYRKGKVNPNASSTYSSTIQEKDDSYFFNPFTYHNVTFNESTLGSGNSKFSNIIFNSITGSYMMSPHNEKLNFNKEDDFSISFYMKPTPALKSNISIGDNLGGGIVFEITGSDAYIVYPELFGGSGTSRLANTSINVEGWGFPYMGINYDADWGGGKGNTQQMDDQNPNSSPTFLGDFINNISLNGYNDWWVPNEVEIQAINTNLTPITNPNIDSTTKGVFPGFNHFVAISKEDGNSAGVIYNLQNNSTPSFSKLMPFFWTFPVRSINTGSFDNKKRHIIAKSSTKTEVVTPLSGQSEILNLNISGNAQPTNLTSEPQFPFEIYMVSESLYFDRSDGERNTSINAIVTSSNNNIQTLSHVLCQKTGSTLEIYINGDLKSSGIDTTEQTQNTANLYIGTKGLLSKNDAGDNSNLKFYNGELSQINIWNKSFNTTTINNISESINTSPYIGNIFYQHGLATITHPKYRDVLSGSTGDGIINNLKFQGSHLIYEHEYQCTIDEHEFNNTLNITARKIKSSHNTELANFTTSSIFKPYITTIGLYNEHQELLVVGKLGQPIKTSNETDTTFVIRWDT